MQKQSYYTRVPVSEKPEKDGMYFVMMIITKLPDSEPFESLCRYKDDRWNNEFPFFSVISWLKPNGEGYFHTEEGLRELIGNGVDVGNSVSELKAVPYYQYRSQYINSIFKQEGK